MLEVAEPLDDGQIIFMYVHRSGSPLLDEEDRRLIIQDYRSTHKGAGCIVVEEDKLPEFLTEKTKSILIERGWPSGAALN